MNILTRESKSKCKKKSKNTNMICNYSNLKGTRISLIGLVLILAILSSVLFSACSSRANSNKFVGTGTGVDDEYRISAATSFYVIYDFAKKIGGDKVIVKNLLPAGSDPHSWEPSPKDIISIEKADVFIYNGVSMEGWVEKVLDSISNKNLIVVETSKEVTLIKDGEENGHIHEEGHEEGHDDQNAHMHLYDPHVWLDPMNAKIQMKSIAEAFAKFDADNADYYEKNFEYYSKELDKLDKEYKDTVSNFKKKDVVVSHEAFGYLCAAYGLNQVGISGLDAEAEPTASRMVEVANFAKDNNVKVIFFDQMVNPKIANAIASSTGAKVDILNPISSLSDKEIKEGKDYFTVMRGNLEALKKALGNDIDE